jgi:hypothetical protein
MAKTIELPAMTDQQLDWLRELLTDASSEALGSASNNHIFALGAQTQEEAIEFEKASDDQREYAHVLLNIAAKI